MRKLISIPCIAFASHLKERPFWNSSLSFLMCSCVESQIKNVLLQLRKWFFSLLHWYWMLLITVHEDYCNPVTIDSLTQNQGGCSEFLFIKCFPSCIVSIAHLYSLKGWRLVWLLSMIWNIRFYLHGASWYFDENFHGTLLENRISFSGDYRYRLQLRCNHLSAEITRFCMCHSVPCTWWSKLHIYAFKGLIWCCDGFVWSIKSTPPCNHCLHILNPTCFHFWTDSS